MNTLVHGSITKSVENRDELKADLLLVSALEIGKAIILGNVTLPAHDGKRFMFNSTPILCSVSMNGDAAIIEIQDVAGLFDLRFVSDEFLATIINQYSKQNATLSLISSIRLNAKSSLFLSASDVLLASNVPPEASFRIANLSTIHGRSKKLAREVTPDELHTLIGLGHGARTTIFGASPTNSVFKINIFVSGPRHTYYSKEAVISLDYGARGNFSTVYEKHHKNHERSYDIDLRKLLNIRHFDELSCRPV